MHPLHLAGHRSLRRLRPPTPAPPPLYRASTPPLHACRVLRCRVSGSVDSLPSFFPLWSLGTRPAPPAPMAPDPSIVIGATVHAKAKHVRSPAECAKVYGSLSNVKMLNGTVTAVERVMTNERHSTWLTARFEVPNKVYVKRLGLLNFLAGPAPDPAPSPPHTPTPSSAVPAAPAGPSTAPPISVLGPMGPTGRPPTQGSDAGAPTTALGQLTPPPTVPAVEPGVPAALSASAVGQAATGPTVAPPVTVGGMEWRDRDAL